MQATLFESINVAIGSPLVSLGPLSTNELEGSTIWVNDEPLGSEQYDGAPVLVELKAPRPNAVLGMIEPRAYARFQEIWCKADTLMTKARRFLTRKPAKGPREYNFPNQRGETFRVLTTPITPVPETALAESATNQRMLSLQILSQDDQTVLETTLRPATHLEHAFIVSTISKGNITRHPKSLDSEPPEAMIKFSYRFSHKEQGDTRPIEGKSDFIVAFWPQDPESTEDRFVDSLRVLSRTAYQPKDRPDDPPDTYLKNWEDLYIKSLGPMTDGSGQCFHLIMGVPDGWMVNMMMKINWETGAVTFYPSPADNELQPETSYISKGDVRLDDVSLRLGLVKPQPGQYLHNNSPRDMNEGGASQMPELSFTVTNANKFSQHVVPHEPPHQ